MPHKRQNPEALAFLEDDEYDDSRGGQTMLLFGKKYSDIYSFTENARYKLQPNRLSIIMASGLMVFLVVDIIVFISMARLLLEAKYSAEEPENMEFRNPYIGLDELYNYHKIKPSHYNTLTNEPRISAQISSAEPSRVFPIDAHRWLSDFGVLSPPDRHLQVTSDVRDLSSHGAGTHLRDVLGSHCCSV